MPDIITFESLYEALRREKVSQELQKLDERFYAKVFSYLQEKNALLKSQLEKAHLFPQEPLKTQKQLANAQKVVQDLFEKRESKILTLAMYAARINEFSPHPNLLREEQQFYADIQNLCATNRTATLTSLFSMYDPLKTVIRHQPQPPATMQSPNGATEKKEGQWNQHPPEPSPPEQKHSAEKPAQQEQKPQSIKTPPVPPIPADPLPIPKKTVKFMHAIPAFIGEDLKVYGPFDKDQTATLPEKAANLLIKKERAEPLTTP